MGWSFRPTWMVASMLLFVIPGGRRDHQDQKRRAWPRRTGIRTMADDKKLTPRGEDFRQLVQRGGAARRAGRLLTRARQYGDSAVGVWHLGEHAAGPGRHVQGDGARERILPPSHPDVLHRKGEGARRGLRSGAGRCHAGRREGARGAVRHPADVRDDHLLDVRQVGAELSGPPDPHESVGKRHAVGDAHAPLLAYRRVPLAGGPHGSRNRRGG